MDVPFRTAGLASDLPDTALLVAFGSRAGGRPRPDSDLDLGVLRSDCRRLTFRELADIHLALSERADVPIDLADLAEADALFRFEVARTGRVLFQGDPSAWTSFVARALIDHDDLAWHKGALVRGVGRRAARGAA